VDETGTSNIVAKRRGKAKGSNPKVCLFLS
jgi:hypothetical protein